jgi:hypothetical protein
MPTKNIGVLSIRSDDSRDVIFSQHLLNNDSVSDTEPAILTDNESFEPMRGYASFDCFFLEVCTRYIEIIYEDLYNQINAINANYEVTITLLFEE